MSTSMSTSSMTWRSQVKGKSKNRNKDAICNGQRAVDAFVGNKNETTTNLLPFSSFRRHLNLAQSLCKTSATVPNGNHSPTPSSCRPSFGAIILAALSIVSLSSFTESQHFSTQPGQGLSLVTDQQMLRYRLGQTRPMLDGYSPNRLDISSGMALTSPPTAVPESISQPIQLWTRDSSTDLSQDDQEPDPSSPIAGNAANQRPAGPPSMLIVRRQTSIRSTGTPFNDRSSNSNQMKSVRHIANGASSSVTRSNSSSINDDICADRLCYGLPMGCLSSSSSSKSVTPFESTLNTQCSVLVTSMRFIDLNRPVARDILFELIALPLPEKSNYASVGFSETGRMAGFVSDCLQYRDPKTKLHIIRLRHSYNIPGDYSNVPVTILSGIKNLGVSYENGYYQCRWIVESAVEFSYMDSNGSILTKREDLGYKNYHILLASGEYNEDNDVKRMHLERVSSMAPVSLAQTGHIKSLGSHILIRIHGSLMVAIWVGLVTLSIVLARYYKNEWSNSKINDLAIWFVVHRTLMLTSWFGSVIAVIFAYMYTETYHPGLHQLSGTGCLILTTVQVIGGLFRPSQESSKRVYFNWTHFICGNVSFLLAMTCLVTAAFLAPAHLPPLYIWIMALFVATYAFSHVVMTVHQYIVHKSSKISITPMNDINSPGIIADSFPKENNSPFRQFMLGILVTIIVIFIVLLISLVNIR